MPDMEMHGVEGVARNLAAFGSRINENLLTEMEILALDMENEAKRNRPWTDRTGNARRSIRGSAGKIGNNLRAVLAIGVYYGVYLELSNGGRYRIIRPTINSFRPRFINSLRRAFR